MRDNSSRTKTIVHGGPARWALMMTCALCASIALGCDEEKTTATTPTAEAPQEKVTASGPLEALEAPDSVIAYGGANDLKAFAEKVKKAFPALAEGADAKVAAAAIGQRVKLTDPSVIELSKPIRFAVLDPKANDDPLVVIVPTTGREAFEKALPADKRKDDAGNAYAVKNGAKLVYVNFLDDWAVISSIKDAFSKHEGFLAKLTGAKLPASAVAVLDAEHTMKIFQSDMEAAMKQLEGNMAQGADGVPGMAGVAKMMEGFGDIAKETDKLIVVAEPIDDGGLVKIDVHPKKGSELAKTFDSLGGQKLDNLDQAPADAPLVVAAKVDPDKTSELTKSLSTWSLQLMAGGSELDEKYEQAMNDYWKATTGDILFVAHQVGEDGGLDLSSIFGVRDAEKLREAHTTLRGMYGDEKLTAHYDKLGMQMSFNEKAYKVGAVSVDTVTMKLDEKKSELGALEGASLFNMLMTSHIAVTDERGVMAYGPDGKEALTAWLDDEVKGGFADTDAAKKALEHAAPGVFFLAYARPLELVQGFSEGKAAEPSKKRGVAISAGAKGGVLSIVADIPQNQVTSIQQGMGGMGL